MTEEIKTFWKFDDTDLATNRRGQLSEKQRTFLACEHKTQRGVFLGVGGVVMLVFLCLPVMIFGSRVVLPAVLSGDSSFPGSFPPGVGLGFVLVLLLPILAVTAIYLLRANRKSDILVKSVQGPIHYSWGTKRVRTPGSSVRNYKDIRVLHLSLGDKKFEVKEELQDILQEGEEWKSYYTSYPFKFLSAEMLFRQNNGET